MIATSDARRQKARRIACERRRAAGLTAYVDTTPAREHIAALVGAGMTLGRIAVLAGVSAPTVRDIASGTRPTARPETITAIMAVTAAHGWLVPMLGSQRRLRALARLGWSTVRLATPTGLTQQHVHVILTGRRGAYVEPDTAAAIAAVYNRIGDRAPAVTTAHDRAGVARVRNAATAAGWPPPAAWDDPDDPAEQPTGWQRHNRTTRRAADHAAGVEDLIELGYSPDEAVRQVADRHRVEVETVYRSLSRVQERAA